MGKSKQDTPDVVWYWYGGTEAGEWRAANLYLSKSLEELVAKIERQGRVAIPGFRRHGAPEGPPSRERFRAVGFIR